MIAIRRAALVQSGNRFSDKHVLDAKFRVRLAFGRTGKATLD
jgi:hypothetical protein